ncbi:hypothetical protein [Pedobacter metabolipauper]|uniref:Uncharacterized protein n=1 Tax=Pedobacter metabolipauper TaxID=425513 RepID=A0A4R6SWF0_9SPHI|nr:hypothetical protein [Pedobacter metabolipauper]TDQ09443.1 hypothetical protein ATK78_1597 [Pedobacter metabolipauper]
MCKPTVISRKGDICVTQCVNCKIVNIWNRGVLISFSFEQFHAFIGATNGLEFDDYLEYSPDGVEVVILATPYPDLSLAFTRVEWYEFFAALNEAAYMQQIYQLVHF